MGVAAAYVQAPAVVLERIAHNLHVPPPPGGYAALTPGQLFEVGEGRRRRVTAVVWRRVLKREATTLQLAGWTPEQLVCFVEYEVVP